MTPWNLFDAAALAVSGSFPLLLVVKATVVLGIVLALVRGMRPARASRRHAVLAAGFVVLAVLPVTILLMPPVGIGIAGAPVATPVIMTTPPHVPAMAAATSVTPMRLGLQRSSPASPVTTSAQTPPQSAGALSAPGTGLMTGNVSIAGLLFILWASGLTVSLAPVVISLERLRRFRAAGECWTEGRARANELAAALGVRRVVDVRMHDGVTTPMTCGWRVPVVLLPRDAPSWHEQEMDSAFVHELEHVRRGDSAIQLFARLVCAAYWCHPLIRIAWRQLHLAADMASDDEVVGRNDARAFAMQLVTMAQTLSEGHVVTPAMARRGGLSARVAALLNPGQRRGRVGTRYASAIIGSAVVCCAGLSSLTASAPPQQTARTEPLPVREPVVVASAAHVTFAARPQAALVPRPAPLAAPLRPAETPVSSNQAVQTQPPQIPATKSTASLHFESARIWKAPGTVGSDTPVTSGTVFLTNGMSIGPLVSWAYGIGIGANTSSPARARPWATVDDSPVRTEAAMAERFDIRGKAPFESREPESGTLGALQYMVQDLLSDRFGLVTHWETRQRSIYILRALPGGLSSLGQQIRPSTLDCDAIRKGVMPPPEERVVGRRPWRTSCGISVASRGMDSPFLPSRLAGSIIGGAVSMRQLAAGLSQAIRAEVIDATSLPGLYDLDLLVGLHGEQSPNDAIREQLGLYLEGQQAPGEVLVIDRVHSPRLD